MLKCKSLFFLLTARFFPSLIPGIKVYTISQYGYQLYPGLVPDAASRQKELQYYSSTDPVISTYCTIHNS